MTETKRFLSVKEYAEMAGISISAVNQRTRRGRLKFTIVYGAKVIDTHSYEPGKSGRPKHE